VDERASGQAINMHVHTQMVQSDFRRAALLAGVLVFLVLLIDFRSVKDAALAMVPVALGWGLMVGCMVVFDVALNLANIVVLPLLLGIGIDAGVHIMHRCRQSAAASSDDCAILSELLEGTGGAVVVATVTTMIGFAGLIIPDHGGMRSLGVVMVIGTGACLLTSVFALPALLVWLRRAR
jgi:predicted RND superfamily exporter protein